MRRDRTGSGGGVMVLLKKSLKLLSYKCLDSIKVIHIALILVQFESFLHGIDLSKQLYIVGDLNIDFCSNNAIIIQPLINNYNLNNCVKDPTRVAKKSNIRHIYHSYQLSLMCCCTTHLVRPEHRWLAALSVIIT